MSDTNVPLLGQEKNEEQAAPVIEVQTAFIIFLTKEGTFAASSDINLPLVTDRVATGNDMLMGVTSVRDEIIVQNTAGLVTMAQMQLAQQAMNARANQEILSKLPPGLAR